MAYAGWGMHGPRVALAVSDDLRSWQRLGLVDFDPDPDPVYGVDFDHYHNKDAALFPEAVIGPDGRPSLALLHRPVYETGDGTPRGVESPLPSIWISYCALEDVRRDLSRLTRLRRHHCLLEPQHPWEALRIGAGPSPLRTSLGWLLIYHGVTGRLAAEPEEDRQVRYAAAAAVLDLRDPRQILYRSPSPILVPETTEETEGAAPDVVFPTGLDDRGQGQIDVYYGMADRRIGAGRLVVPERLPG
jgi:predicted GH43/DUF377 family glycosyl hydrolase